MTSIPHSHYRQATLTKIKQRTLELHVNQLDLTDIHRTFHPNSEVCTFFSASHVIFSKMDYKLWHKASINKFIKTEITFAFFLTTLEYSYISTAIKTRESTHLMKTKQQTIE